MRRSAIATGLAVSLLAAGPAAAETYGLVVGINDYAGVSNDLEGAVADAEDIAQALVRSGAADVLLLTDHGATKAAIEEAWFKLVEQAQPGDTIVFTYAGHGAQEPEPHGRGGETDGLNETFVLGGYSSIGPGVAERIIDDEIFAWLTAADVKGISVIFLADSCHSGTMYRAVGDGLRYRLGDFDPPAEEPTDLPDIAFAVTTEDDFQNVTFIGATQEDRLTPELMIDGVRRGALSWAFARALEGAADLDGDGSLTQHELIAYLVPTVEMQAQNQQRPQVIPISAQAKPLLVIGAGAPRPVAVPEVLLRVYVPNAAALPAIDGVGLVLDPAAADLVWDAATGTVTHSVAGAVAENVAAGDLPAIVSKWAALALLQRYGMLAPFEMTLEEGNAIHHRGEVLTITLGGGTHPHLTMFNLAPNGRVEFLRPIGADEAAMDWTDRTAIERLQVSQPPYGAEHLVAILTETRPDALRAGLRALSGDTGSAGLVALLRTVLTGDVQVGILGIYTAE
ncbi:MAG: caspase family protein [Bauldia sp.]|nr:caspase family protein [Bauldia sp.]